MLKFVYHKYSIAMGNGLIDWAEAKKIEYDIWDPIALLTEGATSMEVGLPVGIEPPEEFLRASSTDPELGD